jgi:3-phosphoshikimate 1-carboxyvinyltransferase
LILAAIPAVAEMRGRLRVPGSKSHTNRALLLAALAEGPVRLRGALECDDADSLRACLAAAGKSVEASRDELRISPGPAPRAEVVFDVRDSGTACRFLAAFAAAAPGLNVRLTGSPRLCERPIAPLVDALRRLGAEIAYLGREGFAPLSIRGRALEGGEVAVDASLSSQFASAILLAAPRMRGGVRLRMEGKEVSRSYVETTLESMESAGLRFRRTDSAIEVEPGPVRTQEIAIPGDFSSAVSLAGSVAVRGGELDLENLEWPSRQADFAAFPVLEKMGVSIAPAGRSIRVSGRARSAVSVEASGFPDAVPVLCAVASRIPGESAFSGIEHLRLKESDRIEAIREMLAADGVVSLAGEGEIRIRGSAGAALPAPVFPTRSDHRIAMASALLCLERGGFVENPRAVEKSYPGFFRDLFRGILQ